MLVFNSIAPLAGHIIGNGLKKQTNKQQHLPFLNGLDEQRRKPLKRPKSSIGFTPLYPPRTRPSSPPRPSSSSFVLCLLLLCPSSPPPSVLEDNKKEMKK